MNRNLLFARLEAQKNTQQFYDRYVLWIYTKWFTQNFDEMFPETGNDNPLFSRDQIRLLVLAEFLHPLLNEKLPLAFSKISDDRVEEMLDAKFDWLIEKRHDSRNALLHVVRDILTRILNKEDKSVLRKAISTVQNWIKIDYSSKDARGKMVNKLSQQSEQNLDSGSKN